MPVKEINDILNAFEACVKTGRQAALATVVKVEGSSYRQPGARMLVTDDGALTGAISGGCLEGDALKKALLCITQGTNKLVTYDTSNEDDADFGVQLGCNGIVHILFEFIDESVPNNPIVLLQQLTRARKDAVILTLFSTDRNLSQPGTCLFYREGEVPLAISAEAVKLLPEAKASLASKASAIKEVNINGNEYTALIEFIPPPITLVIAGAGNDVKPLVTTASALGWDVIVADGRATHAKASRFPEAKRVIVTKAAGLIQQLTIDPLTCFALVTHNYKYDLELLKELLATDASYIGLLGPKTKLNRMLSELEQAGVTISDAQLARIYGPVGLDIGAETAEEIALAVVAEIKAVISGKQGTSLKYKHEKIHSTTAHA